MKSRQFKKGFGLISIIFFLSLIGVIVMTVYLSRFVTQTSSHAGQNYHSIPQLTNGQIQNFPTNDGSGQVVHPDVLFTPGQDNNGWNGHRYWMVALPYPNSNNIYEDPSVYVSENSYTWTVPVGGKNPIVPSAALDGTNHFAGEISSHIHSDADLLIVNNVMYVYYRYSVRTPDNTMILRRVSTTDGIHWTAPQDTNVKIDGQLFASPAVLYANGQWLVYYTDVRNQTVHRKTSSDGINWQNDKTLFSFPFAWHLDVYKYTDPEFRAQHYLMLLVERNVPIWQGSNLFYLSSEDGINWVNKGSILVPSAAGWDNGNIYRSTFDVIGSRFRVWYSAFGSDNKTVHVGYVEDSNWSYYGGATAQSAIVQVPSCRSWSDVYVNSCASSKLFENNSLSCVSDSPSVTLHVFGSFNPTAMKFINMSDYNVYCNSLTGQESGWSAEEPFSLTKNWNFSSVIGQKKVCVMLKNSKGWGTACGAGIRYDNSPASLNSIKSLNMQPAPKAGDNED